MSQELIMLKRKSIKYKRIASIEYFGKRDETTYKIVSECSKLGQREYKISDDWMAKVIHWQLRKRLDFYHTNKLYIQKIESVLVNETHKILWDFKI